MNGAQKTIKILAICLGIIIIINIFSGIFYGLSFITNINLNTQEKTKNFEETYQNIEEIKIDGIISNITIKSGNVFKVTAQNVGTKFSSNIEHNTLKIEENQNIFPKNNWEGNIIITVPKDTLLNKLSIDTGASQVTIQDIYANILDMDNGAGILTITNSKFNKADIDGGAGKISINSSTLNNLDMDTGVGEIEIEAIITGNSEIDCGVGEVNITLLGTKEDYSITIEKGIGNIKIDNENQANDSTYGSGNNKLKLEGGVGNISLNFKNLNNENIK